MQENTDDLFLLASTGNKKANEQLMSWYIDTGFAIASKIAKNNGIYTYNEDNIYYQLIELFQVTLRGFTVGNIPFKNYATFLLKKRLPAIVVKESIGEDTSTLSLDLEDEDGLTLHDILPSDDYINMVKKLYVEDNKQTIASTKISTRKNDKKIKKILYYKDLGFKRTEICKLLNISIWQYRYLERLMNKHSNEIKTYELK